MRCSELRLLRRSRERNHIPDVLHPRDELDHALEAEAEARVRDGAVAPQVTVPPVVFLLQTHLFQAQVETPERGPESTGLRHVAFMVGRDDLARAQTRLGEHGVEFRFEDHGNAHSVYFRDPDGNVIELTTYEP